MLLLTALVALAVFLFVRNTRHHRAATALENLGADIGYLGARQGWLESIFGRATIQDVTDLTCEGERFGDEHMGYVGTLESVRWLSLAESRVTNRGLAQLSDLKDLTTLNLNGTKIMARPSAATTSLMEQEKAEGAENRDY